MRGLSARSGVVGSRTYTGPETKLLDATERLLISNGHAGITTRRVASEAGLNHGLIHYYFGSVDELLLQVLERFTARLIERHREMYAGPEPFLTKWRTAMRFLEQDYRSGYQKVWLELQALGWNRPDLRDRIALVDEEWRRVLTEAFTEAMSGYDVDVDRFPVDAVVALVTTFNQGMILEMHSGVTTGHVSLLRMIEQLLVDLDGGERS